MSLQFPERDPLFRPPVGCAGGEATALANHEKIPVGIYLNTMAFFTIYHTAGLWS